MSFHPVLLLARVCAPKSHRAIVCSTDQAAAIRREGDAMYAFLDEPPFTLEFQATNLAAHLGVP
jgi:hypothetical protein